MAGRNHDKTEAPTPKRKKEARRDGRVARSNDLVGWLSLLIATLVLPGLIRGITDAAKELLLAAVAMARHPDAARLPTAMGKALSMMLTAMLPTMLTLVGLAIAANVAQVGFIFTGKPLKPKLKHLNPMAGLKRMFSVKGLWQALAQIVKLGTIGLVVWTMVKGVSDQLIGSPARSTTDAIASIGALSLHLVQIVAVVCTLLGLADYAIKKRALVKEMKMSKQEIKQEYKDAEGDQHVRARMRSNRMAMSRNRMISAVALADVIITNPTHFAIAISYQREKGAPKVVARGADATAARIREEARRHGVPCVESKPLARTLYRLCRPGEEIPRELYQAVATVLAFIQRLSLAHKSYGGTLGLDVVDSWTPQHGSLERISPRRRRTLEKRLGQTTHAGPKLADGVR